MEKKTVFLTGATGNMGWAGFQELYSRKTMAGMLYVMKILTVRSKP